MEHFFARGQPPWLPTSNRFYIFNPVLCFIFSSLENGFFRAKEKGHEALSILKPFIKMLPRSNSKLCFKLLEILQQLKTTCPCAGG